MVVVMAVVEEVGMVMPRIGCLLRMMGYLSDWAFVILCE